MKIREATDFILDSGEPVKWIRLLDMYVEQYRKYPSAFVLPREHYVLEPLVAVFVRNPEQLVPYIKVIRDTLPKGEQAFEVNGLYRTILTRYVQQERRERMARALDKAEDLFGKFESSEERSQYENKLYALWATRRKELLAKGAKTTGRLSVQERADVLELFWKEIDKEIDEGRLPPKG